jgi:two-component system, cell cycle sensor histidine kinase and response regulator CckA
VSTKKQTRKNAPRISDKAEIRNCMKQYGKLAGGIAHDLNTILTTIYGYSEMALETVGETSEAGQNIRNIILAADRARTLTGHLMDLSRPSANERKTVRVSEIIKETVSLMRPSVPQGTQVTENISSAEVMVTADPLQLFRAFTNLAVNALQAMESTGGMLTITLETITRGDSKKLKAGEYALIRFADTGKGMDKKTADKMFDPYFTSRMNGDGTGLGLSLVYEIISDLEGDINVSSKLNEGTVIEILIPAETGKFVTLP